MNSQLRTYAFVTSAVVAGTIIGCSLPLPAYACNVVSIDIQTGEPLCATTSDGGGQNYTDGRYRRWQIERRIWDNRRPVYRHGNWYGSR
jgi:hypothetical protein